MLDRQTWFAKLKALTSLLAIFKSVWAYFYTKSLSPSPTGTAFLHIGSQNTPSDELMKYSHVAVVSHPMPPHVGPTLPVVSTLVRGGYRVTYANSAPFSELPRADAEDIDALSPLPPTCGVVQGFGLHLRQSDLDVANLRESAVHVLKDATFHEIVKGDSALGQESPGQRKRQHNRGLHRGHCRKETRSNGSRSTA